MTHDDLALVPRITQREQRDSTYAKVLGNASVLSIAAERPVYILALDSAIPDIIIPRYVNPPKLIKNTIATSPATKLLLLTIKNKFFAIINVSYIPSNPSLLVAALHCLHADLLWSAFLL